MVWAMSPVGGQASLRQMTVSTARNLPIAFEYMVHNGYAAQFQSMDGFGLTDFVGTLLNGAIIAPASIRSSARDLWANVKIPRVEHYEKYAVAAEEEEWYSTRASDGRSYAPLDRKSYSSLIGIPINGMDSSRYINYSMRIDTQYLNVACTYKPGVNLFDQESTIPNKTFFLNYSSSPTYSMSEATFFYRKSRNSTADKVQHLTPYEIIYATRFGWDDMFTLNCNVTGPYVEVEVFVRTADLVSRNEFAERV